MLAYAALLFVVLTPGVLMRLPPNGSKMTVALTHGVVFAVVWYFTNKMVWRASYEGFQSAPITPGGMGTPPVVMARAAVTQAQKELDAAKEDVTKAQRSVQLANQGLLVVKRTLESKMAALEAAYRTMQLENQGALRAKQGQNAAEMAARERAEQLAKDRQKTIRR